MSNLPKKVVAPAVPERESQVRQVFRVNSCGAYNQWVKFLSYDEFASVLFTKHPRNS